MTSHLTSTRQVDTDSGYFITVGDATAAVFTRTSVLAVAAGTSTTLVAWSAPASFLGGVGDLFKDMGRTVNANGLVFRKVQYVEPTTVANGVGGAAATSTDDGYNTGYILLGLNGAAGTTITAAVVAPVAKYGV